MRHAAGQVWAKEAITDLGRPSTPRKEARGNGAEETESAQKSSTIGNGSAVANLVFSGGGQVSQTSNAPMADSALSSIGEPASARQGFGPNSVMINLRGEMAATVELTDVRRQLMTMGLFPPNFYRVGETFEEMRRRYVPLSISSQRRLTFGALVWMTKKNLHKQRTRCNFDREKLADADPPVEELAERLRSWDAALTRLKTDGILAELPTKRLLMQYTQGFVDRADPPGSLQVKCTSRDF